MKKKVGAKKRYNSKLVQCNLGTVPEKMVSRIKKVSTEMKKEYLIKVK